MTDLPIHAVLPDLLAALRTRNGAVLIAPPGAYVVPGPAKAP